MESARADLSSGALSIARIIRGLCAGASPSSTESKKGIADDSTMHDPLLLLLPADTQDEVRTYLGKAHEAENEACQTDDHDCVEPHGVDPDGIIGRVHRGLSVAVHVDVAVAAVQSAGFLFL